MKFKKIYEDPDFGISLRVCRSRQAGRQVESQYGVKAVALRQSVTEAGSLSDPFTVGRRGVGKPRSTKSGWKKKFTPHHSTTTIQNTNKCTHIAKTELQTRPFYSSGAERGWQATQHKEWLEEGKHITTHNGL